MLLEALLVCYPAAAQPNLPLQQEKPHSGVKRQGWAGKGKTWGGKETEHGQELQSKVQDAWWEQAVTYPLPLGAA